MKETLRETPSLQCNWVRILTSAQFFMFPFSHLPKGTIDQQYVKKLGFLVISNAG